MEHANHAEWLFELLVAAAGLLVAVGLWFGRFLLVKITECRAQGRITCDKLAILELKIAEEYVSALTFKEAINSFKSEALQHHKEIQDRFAKLESYMMKRRGGD
jgi:hypothetical protein